MSQGMHGGGHSGETVLKTGLDNLLQQPNVVVVKSAGNEQQQNIHTGGQISEPDAIHRSMPGTSMAAPHVTGVAALILGVRPNLTCEHVKQIMMRAARRDGFAAGAANIAWGSGKLDATAAVELARTAQRVHVCGWVECRMQNAENP
jgi:hypothetical protein